MSAIESPSTTPTNAASSLVLSPVLTGRFALRWQHCVVCAFFACVYLMAAYLPLSPVVIWRHLQIGDWILSHRMLPNIDPFLPLADGMPWMTTSWLSEVLLSGVYRIGGAQGLSSCLSLLVLTMGFVTARTAFVQTGRNRWAILAAGVVLAFHWPQITVLRPELFGLCCFVVLLWRLNRWQNEADEMPRSSWVFVPLLFALWANLDGSVFVGLFVMGCLALGGLIDSAWTYRSPTPCGSVDDFQAANPPGHKGLGDRMGELQFISRVWIAIGQPRNRRLVLLAELAAAATLLQPLGWDLWFDLGRGGRSTVWSEKGGFNPLVLASGTGFACLLLWLTIAVLLRVSRRRIRAADVLLLGGLSLAVASSRHLTLWLAPVACWVLLPHLAEVFERSGWFRPKLSRLEWDADQPMPSFAFKYSVVSALLIWCAFSLSPLSNPVLGRQPLALERVVSKQAPFALGRHLQQHSYIPNGLVWVPEDWGDWLSWTGAKELKVSMNSRRHVLPERLRQDIVLIARAEGNWTRTLDRYNVELLVVDKQRQPRLADAALGQGSDWTVDYEDSMALVFRRRML